MIFKNDSDFEFFDTFGYLKTTLLNEDEVEMLKALYNDTEDESGLSSNFYTTIWSDNVDYKSRVNEGISRIITPALSRVFKDYHAAFANFMVKKAGQFSSLQAHQDWTFVEEPQYYSVTVWIPLEDVTKENGALEVLPKSHNLKNYKRARFLNAPFSMHNKYIVDNLMKSIPMSKGEALVVNSRTIHASPDNLSDKTRIVASIVLYPSQAELTHYILKENSVDEIEELAITPKFFTDYSCFDRPHDLNLIAKFKVDVSEVNISELSKIK